MVITKDGELKLLALLLKWQNDAPKDGCLFRGGLLEERNTQVTRLGYFLRIIVQNNDDYERIYKQLELVTRRTRDDNSYFSQQSSWMKEPYCIKENWFFEGCTSLRQKQGFIHEMTKIRLSSGSRLSTQCVDCASDFIAGKNLEEYQPPEDSKEFVMLQEVIELLMPLNLQKLAGAFKS